MPSSSGRGILPVFLLLLREHHGLRVSNPDTNADSHTHANSDADTNPDADTNRNAHSYPDSLWRDHFG